MQAAAFLGALAAVGLVHLLARSRGDAPIVTLVLSGVIVGAMFAAGVSMVKYLSDDAALRQLVFWLMGGFYFASWGDVTVAGPIVAASAAVMIAGGWRLNVLSMGDHEAATLGVDPRRARPVLLGAATLATAVSVSVAGIVPWIGLMTPHAIRLLIGPDNRLVVPGSALLGAVILLACDTAARSITQSEIPVGIIRRSPAGRSRVLVRQRTAGRSGARCCRSATPLLVRRGTRAARRVVRRRGGTVCGVRRTGWKTTLFRCCLGLLAALPTCSPSANRVDACRRPTGRLMAYVRRSTSRRSAARARRRHAQARPTSACSAGRVTPTAGSSGDDRLDRAWRPGRAPVTGCPAASASWSIARAVAPHAGDPARRAASGLDFHNQVRIWGVLRSLAASGAAVLCCTRPEPRRLVLRPRPRDAGRRHRRPGPPGRR